MKVNKFEIFFYLVIVIFILLLVAAARAQQPSGGNFTLYTGFWTPEDFAPTAATAVVGGSIKTYNGTGIRNVAVTIIFPDGEIRRTYSGSFGFYSFNDIPTGETYAISISAKRYRFASSTLVKHIFDDTRDIKFVAKPD